MMPGIGRRALLIGGMGFIGRHLTRACRVAGMTVRVADAVAQVDDAVEPDVDYIQGDYRDRAFVRRIVDGVDFVVHLVHDTMLLNLECNMSMEIERNVQPAIQLMDICCSAGITKFLFVSSGGTVYGDRAVPEPISEDAPTRPISVYGTSKLMIEHLGFLYYAQKNLPFLAARPANAYGPGQLPFRGQGFVATALASALQEGTLNVFGDGSVVRDYVHVHDIANALVALLERGRAGEAYNIGTERGTSLRTLVDDFITPTISSEGYSLQCRYSPERRADVVCNVLANSKLQRDTGVAPRITLVEGLPDTWKWLKQTHGGTPTDFKWSLSN